MSLFFLFFSTLTVVEESIQPSQIQREVECLNDDLFKNLLDDDLGKPAAMPASIPFHQAPSNHVDSFEHRIQSKQMDGK